MTEQINNISLYLTLMFSISHFPHVLLSQVGLTGFSQAHIVTVQGALSAPLVVLSCSAACGLGNQCRSCGGSAQITS